MKTFIDSTFFRVTPPEDDRNLSSYFVQPAVFSALLNPESTLLAAPSGYGKSTLVFFARQAMQKEWLNVRLEQLGHVNDDFMAVLLRHITQGMWQYIVANPASLARLQTRAMAARYFLEHFSDINIDYLLACLVDDAPSHAEIIEIFRAVQPRELFTANTGDTQRLSILCDCIEKLGMKGVVLWIDLAQELKRIPPTLLQVIEAFFDSLHITRQRMLHIKCVAPPSVCHYLQTLRGMETLSVNLLTLQWQQEQLQQMIDQRLLQASDHQIHSLAQLVDPAAFVAFLTEFSDVESPAEWLTLLRLIADTLGRNLEIPLSEQAWLQVRRAYCAERVKIRLDEQGGFWRGKQLLTELTPRKRAIYPLVKYLYEHPGVHRTYNLVNVLEIDENNLNTIISRARKEHLEPFPPTEADSIEGWVYLVTDLKGGGYALKHTVRSA